MPIQVDRSSELLAFLYSAVGDLTLWNEFLARVSEHLGAQRTAFLSIDPDSQRTSVHLYTGWPPDAVGQDEAYYGALDFWYLGYKNQGRRAWTGTGDSLCPPSKLEKTEFYNDFLQPHDVYHECGVIL